MQLPNQLHDQKLPSFLSHIQGNWRTPIEAEIIAELKQVVAEKRKENQQKYIVKVFCLFVLTLGLLSFGLCVQADAIAQALREVARISVQQVLQGSNLTQDMLN